jgi:aspartyl-tRNA(Asn)/glutamyl-tRNA(Gln) amidotransferase subunit C
MDKKELIDLSATIKIALNEEEINILHTQINDILQYVSNVNTCDFDKLDTCEHLFDEYCRLRTDESKASISLNDALKNAPNKNENFFKVPKVLE